MASQKTNGNGEGNGNMVLESADANAVVVPRSPPRSPHVSKYWTVKQPGKTATPQSDDYNK